MDMTAAPRLDLTGQEYAARRDGLIAELRRQSWYAHNETGFVLFNQEDALHVLRSPDFRFSYFFIDPEANPYLADRVQGVLLAKHGADHRRLRALVARAFRDRVVAALGEVIERIAHDLIDRFPEGGEVDLVEAFTRPFPARILGPMLGVPYESVDDIDDWISISAANVDPQVPKEDLAAIADAWRRLEGFLFGLLDQRRGNLGNDIFSELIAAEVDGDRLKPHELIGLASELARAGVETTRCQMALTLRELLRHPGQWEMLRADRSLAAGAVEEGLRYAPFPQTIPQQAARDMEYRGLAIEAGQVAMVLIPAANRDPAVVERPQAFDITRAPPPRHFAFGFGTHYCSGVNLARMEMTHALGAFAKRIGSMRLLEEPAEMPVSRGCVPLSLRVALTRI